MEALMGEYHIFGGNKINGETGVCGGKNAVLPILAAALLNSGTSVLHNCPLISDTLVTVEILKSLGCEVGINGNTITVDSSGCSSFTVPEKLAREMRSSILFLGSLAGRFGSAIISYPGGCELGARPIDMHLKAFREMGLDIKEEHGFIIANTVKLSGIETTLDKSSVGTTENIMLAAVLADGITVIKNAAREPEIVDLAEFLTKMGADISGAGSDTIKISGVKALHDAEHTIISDRIVAGTLLIAAAITKGELTLTRINPKHLSPLAERLEETGCEIKTYENEITLTAPDKILPLDVLRTNPFPGFPTDMQPQMTTYLSVAGGTSIIIETVFESRFRHIGELKKMGTDILVPDDGRMFIIRGVNRLSGTAVSAWDLRGGAALILAGLAAEGKTIVQNSEFVERGYEKVEELISSIGGDMIRVEAVNRQA